ncbi:hypothetical protein TREES_T100014388 [Tupaia chinensis]|uniref:Uncharacterized protein n=1 Tax=Tupaia chinensis TaxID=246437 RepID=L9JAV2_TUPCH|nr:hypothetical protein TREES_T100014388 [Tupaia chinensis]
MPKFLQIRRQGVSRKSSVDRSTGIGTQCRAREGFALEASQPGSRRAKEAALEVRAQPGTLSPAAEDGVGETGAALGAPYQLHQLFSQFGHDGVLAGGSSLSGLLPRNMGKERLRRQELRDGGGGKAV